MKNNTKISSTFIAFLAIVILFVSSFSSLVSNKIEPKKTTDKYQSSSKKSKSNNQVYFTKTAIEAVFSPILPSFACDAVIFLVPDFKFVKKEIFLRCFQNIGRNIYLEVLFEHLNAPNAP